MSVPTFDELTDADRLGVSALTIGWGLKCRAGHHQEPGFQPPREVSCRCACHRTNLGPALERRASA